MITEERFYCVYKHTFPNNKVYIGITCKKPTYRWNNGNGYKKECNLFMFNAIKKYGWNNIKHEILFSKLSKEEAEKKEIELIQYYKSTNQKYGYNLMSGGSCGRHCEETKRKIFTSQKGRHLSNETKRRISKSMKMLYKNSRTMTGKSIIRCDDNKIYNSIMQASRELNIPKSNISACCNGRRKTAGGYIWQFQRNA